MSTYHSSFPLGLIEAQQRHRRTQKLGDILRSSGLKVSTQKYEYSSSGRAISGQNVYAILQGPRADATEAIVLVGAWTNMDEVVNHSGVALVLTLARYFKSRAHTCYAFRHAAYSLQDGHCGQKTSFS